MPKASRTSKNNNKMFLGVMLILGGLGAIFFGLLFSLTVFGACIGIPLVMVGLLFLVWGVIWVIQANTSIENDRIMAAIQGQTGSGAEHRPENPHSDS